MIMKSIAKSSWKSINIPYRMYCIQPAMCGATPNHMTPTITAQMRIFFQALNIRPTAESSDCSISATSGRLRSSRELMGLPHV